MLDLYFKRRISLPETARKEWLLSLRNDFQNSLVNEANTVSESAWIQIQGGDQKAVPYWKAFPYKFRIKVFFYFLFGLESVLDVKN